MLRIKGRSCSTSTVLIINYYLFGCQHKITNTHFAKIEFVIIKNSRFQVGHPNVLPIKEIIRHTKTIIKFIILEIKIMILKPYLVKNNIKNFEQSFDIIYGKYDISAL